ATVVQGQEVPCYFIFGDSTFDSGNNNNLNTKAKVNFSPYGIDFPNGPTGRFTNGRTVPDLIGELLGFKEFIPPSAEASPEQAHIGINYASGGGGLREETSQHLGGRISLKAQIQNHKKAIKTAKPGQYAFSLITLYRAHMKSLHGLGARKVALFGVCQIGCTPKMVRSHGEGKGCAREVNDAVTLFNKNIEDLVKEFNRKVKGAKFTFVDLFSGGDPVAFKGLGYKVDKGCCEISPGEELCIPNRPACANRTEYIFFDDIHSSEPTNMIVAKGAFEGLLTKPYSIPQLVKQ
ncbi:hypothetical protein AALP_AA3G354400, partial [Arabis alpina]